MARHADTEKPVMPPYRSSRTLPAQAAAPMGIPALRSILYTLMPIMVMCSEEMLKICRMPFLLYKSFSSASSPDLSPKRRALMTDASFSGKIRYSRLLKNIFTL